MKVHKAVINVSPLCDVCFTTLCTLIMIVPVLMITGKIKINLPGAHVREMRDEGALFVTVSADGRIAIEDKELPLEEAMTLLKEKIQEKPERTVVIRADRFVLHGTVIEFLRAAKIYGAEKIAVAVEQKGIGGE